MLRIGVCSSNTQALYIPLIIVVGVHMSNFWAVANTAVKKGEHVCDFVT